MTDRIEKMTLPITLELQQVDHGKDGITTLTERAELIRDRVSGLTGLHEDELVAAAKALWDVYVGPVNFPGIPPVIQPLLKRLVWAGLEAVLRKLIPDEPATGGIL